MKSQITILSLFLALIFMSANLVDGEGIALGETTPALANKVIELDGSEKVLRSYASTNGLLVIFSCNTCPFVLKWEDRYPELYDYCKVNEIGMVLINSNEAYRENEDSKEAMIKHAEDQGYSMPYVIDQNHLIADSFEAKTTPHVFLFNSKLVLAYKGAIDNNFKNKNDVTQPYLFNAMKNMIDGAEIEPAETKAMGCSIKRVKKN
ncbi:MAG TPA: thioredoxin family protein [Flavobacteriales bacterium]|jgi:hypothetical protein|nr:thioredoxin family protein [Flavobacteriales bacterium]